MNLFCLLSWMQYTGNLCLNQQNQAFVKKNQTHLTIIQMFLSLLSEVATSVISPGINHTYCLILTSMTLGFNKHSSYTCPKKQILLSIRIFHQTFSNMTYSAESQNTFLSFEIVHLCISQYFHQLVYFELPPPPTQFCLLLLDFYQTLDGFLDACISKYATHTNTHKRGPQLITWKVSF